MQTTTDTRADTRRSPYKAKPATDFRKKITQVFNAFNGSNFYVLDKFYARDVIFQDPAVKVEGLEEVKKYYAHTYKNIESIDFEFGAIVRDGQTYVAPWTATIKLKSWTMTKPYEVDGNSMLRFNEEGRCDFHRDYVDLGAMVYEQIPGIGLLLQQVKKRMAAFH